MTCPANVPRVFISYSHDSPEHANRVLALSDRLRADGLDCHIDQYEPSPNKPWAQWMLDQIEEADFVLAVCTEEYKRRFRGKSEPGIGRGVTWEGAIINQDIYDAHGGNAKFRAVTFASDQGEHIPFPLSSYSYYDVSSETGYDNLYRWLTNQPDTPKPALGKMRAMPQRERRNSFGS